MMATPNSDPIKPVSANLSGPPEFELIELPQRKPIGRLSRLWAGILSPADRGVRVLERWRMRSGRRTLADRLSVAGLHMSLGAFGILQVAVVVAGGIIGSLANAWIEFPGDWIPIVAGMVVALPIPRLVVGRRETSRLHLFEAQLPDGLLHLSNALKAGRPFAGAIRQVADFAARPLSTEFGKMAGEIALGRSPVDAIRHAGERLRSTEWDLVVAMVTIYGTVGGDLSLSLENMSDTLEQRLQMREEMHATTAHPRTTAALISLAPVGLALALTLIAPHYFEPMTRKPLGLGLLGLAAGLVILGDYVVLRLNKVDI